MKTKHLLLFGLLLATIPALNSCKKEGCTDLGSYSYDKDAQKNDGSCVEVTGCLGFSSGFNNSGTVGNTFYDQANDMQFSDEIGAQSYFWQGIPATVYVWYEPYGMYNAVSTTDGNILFGYNMFYNTLQNLYNQGYQNPDYAIDGILAHEWGHQIQFNYGWGNQGVELSELEADAFSGFYIAAGKQWDNNAVQAYITNVYYSGSYDFNNPSFHGTPDQRSSAADLGIQYGVNALSGTNYTYADLHEIFTSEIISYIMKKATHPDDRNKYITQAPNGKIQVKKIDYPAVTRKVQVLN